MSYIISTVGREAKRMCALRESYEKQLSNLPKGSLVAKERSGNKYFYLTYRSGGKVVSDYVGYDEAALTSLKEQLERRKGIEKLLKGIKNELRLLNKVLEATK